MAVYMLFSHGYSRDEIEGVMRLLDTFDVATDEDAIRHVEEKHHLPRAALTANPKQGFSSCSLMKLCF